MFSSQLGPCIEPSVRTVSQVSRKGAAAKLLFSTSLGWLPHSCNQCMSSHGPLASPEHTCGQCASSWRRQPGSAENRPSR